MVSVFVDFELFFYLFAVGCVVPGAGAFEIAAHASLTALKETVSTRARLGVQVSNLSDTWFIFLMFMLCPD